MMRIYRGKRKSGEWVYGYFIAYPDDDCYICVSSDNTNILDKYRVIPKTVGQYTGLMDRNGTKIFDGDLLRFPAKNDWQQNNYELYEVFWHDNDCADCHIGWQFNRVHFVGALSGKDIGFTTFLPKYTLQMEVIGNIHDNGDLLQ